MDKSKIRVIFEYEFRRGTNAAQTTRNINEVFGKDVANERTIRRWFEKFRSGDFDLQNEPRGRPESKVNDDELKAVVEANTSQSTRELAARFGVTIPTILNHLKHIGKVKKLDRWIPHELNECQKRNCFEAYLSKKEGNTKNTNKKIKKRRAKETDTNSLKKPLKRRNK